MTNKRQICPNCKREVVKDKAGNYFVEDIILISHSIGCDNKYLKNR